MFRRSMHHRQTELLSPLKTICYCKVVTVVELQSTTRVTCDVARGFTRSSLIFKKQTLSHNNEPVLFQ
jgi:hypothetical protein